MKISNTMKKRFVLYYLTYNGSSFHTSLRTYINIFLHSANRGIDLNVMEEHTCL